MEENAKTKERYTVEEVIDSVVNDWDAVADETCQRFNEGSALPPFYDEEKFRRGQQFYHKHIFAMLLGKLLGLMTIISTPTILHILTYTRRSDRSMTAYKRYMATIFHMCVWYDSDFKPGSALWRSIAAVRNMHNSASKRSCAVGINRVLQKDMGITQFGFMGYALVRPKLIGIHGATREELEGLVHLWRVVAYIMGTEDRFNICRESLEETAQICEALIERIFVPNIKQQDPEYLILAEALVSGMWVMEPSLNFKTHMMYMYHLLNYNFNNNESRIPAIELTTRQRFGFQVIVTVTHYIQYAWVRWFYNWKQYVSFWLLRNFPFLAFYQYGYKNSYVSIYIEKGSS